MVAHLSAKHEAYAAGGQVIPLGALIMGCLKLFTGMLVNARYLLGVS